jgi:hypothetical protein
MKLHHTKYKKNYREYILNCVDLDNEGELLKTDQEKINYIFNRFNSEYSRDIERVGKFRAMSEWLSGLALPIEYMDYDIVELAIKLGSINPNPSDKLYDKVCDTYFDFMANIILGLEKEVKNVK